MMEEIGRVILKEVSVEDFERVIGDTDNSIKKLEPVLKKLYKSFEGLDPSQRFFLCDAIVGSVLNSSKLPSYLLASIASKYFVLGSLPHLQVLNKPEVNPHPSYLG
jgi:hypothetical protein